MAKVTQRGEDPQPHPRDVTGRPPTWKDFSPSGQRRAAGEFRDIASNPQTLASNAATHAAGRVAGWREKNPEKADNVYVGHELRRQEQMETITSMVSNRPRPVTMNVAANRIAENYTRAGERTLRGDIAVTPESSPSDIRSAANVAAGRGTVMPTGGPWYREHGGEVRKVAEAYGADPRATVLGSASMSPQNSPANEREAIHGITAAVQQDRKVSMLSEPQIHERLQTNKIDTKTQRAHVQAREDLAMGAGTTKSFSEFTPEQVALMPRHRSLLGGNVDYERIAKSGTEGATGVRMARGELGQSDLGATGKVPSYAHQDLLGAGLSSLGESAPDQNDWSEYGRRLHESIPGNHPYFEQPTLFGKAWEADPYGRAHSTSGILNPGHQPDSPLPASRAAKEWYPETTAKYEGARKAGDIELHEATTANDTWMMAQSLALPRTVEGAHVNAARNPAIVAKTLASDPQAVSFGGGDVYMPTPSGGRKASPSEVQHAVFNEVTNRAAGVVTERARAAGRNVGAGVPVVAVQGASWTGYRMEHGKDPDYTKRLSSLSQPPNAAAPGSTPKPGQDVPMFDESGTALDYGKTWRPKRRK